MIKIEGVRPTPVELRPIRLGWGLLHWACCLPYGVYFGGIAALAGIAISAGSPGDGAGDAVGLTLLAILILSGVSHAIARDASRVASARAPSAGQSCDWSFAEEGLTLITACARGTYDWAIIMAVKEEKDRFVFLMTPSNNPVLPKRNLNDDQTHALRALIAKVRASGRLGAGVDYTAPPSDKA